MPWEGKGRDKSFLVSEDWRIEGVENGVAEWGSTRLEARGLGGFIFSIIFSYGSPSLQ